MLSPAFAVVLAIYFLLNLAYSRWLKHIPILDVMIVAAGFVLRVHAGTTLIEVERFSPWLYVVTTLGALYLGFGKRRSELALLAQGAGSHRKVLEGYTLPLLDQYITIVSAATILAYSLYTFSAPNLPENHSMMLTIPFMAYIIFRYLYIIHVTHHAGRAGGGPALRPSDADRPAAARAGCGGCFLLALVVKASAPGKIILFGEHAVVYGRPALAVPVTQVQAEAEIAALARMADSGSTPPIFPCSRRSNALPSDHPLAAVIHNLLFSFGISPFPPLEIRITSTIPVASGLGSGAAVTVAILRALSAHLDHPLSDEQVNQFAYEIEKLHHGTPSGIDNTVVTYAQPVYFMRGQPVEIFQRRRAVHPRHRGHGHPRTDEGIRGRRPETVGGGQGHAGRRSSMRSGEIAEQARDAIERGETAGTGQADGCQPGAPAGTDRLLDRTGSPDRGRPQSRGGRGKTQRRRARRQPDRPGGTREGCAGRQVAAGCRCETHDHHRGQMSFTIICGKLPAGASS